MSKDQSLVLDETAHVRPEDVKLIGGAQSTEDKIETLLRQLEAKANMPGTDTLSRAIWYAAVIGAFAVGALFSGYSGGGGGGGVPNPTPIGSVDIAPALEATTLLFEVMLHAG